MYPTNHVYNPNFKYVPAAHTDIRLTFERIKRDQERTIEVIREYEVVTVTETVCCTNNHPSNEEVRRMLGFGLIQHKEN